MPVTYHACNLRQTYLTVVCWRHGHCWNSFRAACSPMQDYRRFHYRGTRNYFSRLCQLTCLWISTQWGAAGTFSGRSAKRGRHPGSAILHGQSAVSCFPSRGIFLRPCTCGNYALSNQRHEISSNLSAQKKVEKLRKKTAHKWTPQ